MVQAVELDIAGRKMRLETGRMAKLADGAVLASYGDTMVLATAVSSKILKPDTDFCRSRSIIWKKPIRPEKFRGGISSGKGLHRKKKP